MSFGLVSIGVKLYSATEDRDIRFHQVHRKDGGRIKYQRVCSIDGKEVSYDEIAKGYDMGGGEMVILTDTDFRNLPLTSSRAIEVLEFVPSEQIDPIYYDKAYYLEPDGAAGVKPYLLMRESLTHSERVAVVKVALRQRESLATLRVRDDVLVLNTMLWPDEIRRAEFGFLDEDVKLRPQEVKMAESLIDSMAGEFDPTQFKDEYREALQEVIDVKIGKRETVSRPEVEEKLAPTIDLMAALRQSVERARQSRSGGEPASVTPIKKAEPQKAEPKKASSKQAAPKKDESKKDAKKASSAQKSSAAKGTSKGTSKAAAKAGSKKTGSEKAGKKAA